MEEKEKMAGEASRDTRNEEKEIKSPSTTRRTTLPT